MCVVSVIVPIYNVEQYLSMCIHSIMNQTLKEIEILLIDDGSTDRSGELADYFQEQDSRIKVVHQENKGLSAARNVGLDMAQGTYIAFVDSDDWIVKNALEKLVEAAEFSQADMIKGNVVFCYKSGRRNIRFKLKDTNIAQSPIKGSQCFIKLCQEDAFAPMVCGYLYRRDFIETNNFRFALTIHEDELWTLVAMCLADKVQIIDFNFYVYRQRKGSIVYSLIHEKRCINLIYVANLLVDFVSQYNYLQEKELISWIYMKIFWLYYCAYSLLPYIENRDFLLPSNNLEDFNKIHPFLTETAKERCSSLYKDCKQFIL